jgi:hypothetical protein
MYVVISTPNQIFFYPHTLRLKLTMALLDNEQIAIDRDIAESVAPLHHMRPDSYRRQRSADTTADGLVGDFEKGTYIACFNPFNS